MDTDKVKQIVAEETAKIDNSAIPSIVVGKDLRVERPWEFREMRIWLKSVKNHKIGNTTEVDPRLFQNAATTYGQEAVGTDGGFATPTVFAQKITEIWKNSEEYKIIEACDTFFTTSNNTWIPVDVSTPWGTTGIYAAWEGEASTMAQRKPSLKQEIVMLNRLDVLCNVSRELEQDGLDMSGHISRKAATAIGFKAAQAIISGNGTGQPQGYLNAGTAPVSVTRSVALSVAYADIAAMYDKMTPSMRQTAVWIANPRMASKIGALTVGSYQSAVVPIGGFAMSGAVQTLWNRPVIYTEAADKTPGYVGDIAFVDLQCYALLMKTTGVEYALSTEFYFDQNANAHRMILRMGGRNVLQAPITYPDATTGSNIIVCSEKLT